MSDKSQPDLQHNITYLYVDQWRERISTRDSVLANQIIREMSLQLIWTCVSGSLYYGATFLAPASFLFLDAREAESVISVGAELITPGMPEPTPKWIHF